MKLLLLAAFSLCTILLFAQPGNKDEILKKYELLQKYQQGQYKNDSLPDQFNQYFRRYKFDVTLSSIKNSIISLPQDNMPCVVPDSARCANIPNAWSNLRVPFRSPYHPIPNPGLRQGKLKFQLNSNNKQHQIK